MDEAGFWYSTPRFVQATLEAHERRERREWERSRLVAYFAFSSQPRKQQPRMTDLIRFPWEKPAGLVASKADIESLMAFDSMDHDFIFNLIEQGQNGG